MHHTASWSCKLRSITIFMTQELWGLGMKGCPAPRRRCCCSHCIQPAGFSRQWFLPAQALRQLMRLLRFEQARAVGDSLCCSPGLLKYLSHISCCSGAGAAAHLRPSRLMSRRSGLQLSQAMLSSCSGCGTMSQAHQIIQFLARGPAHACKTEVALRWASYLQTGQRPEAPGCRVPA